MKKIIGYLVCCCFVMSCQLTPTKLGEDFIEKDIMTLESVLERIRNYEQLKSVQIEGKIYKTCLSEGCWFIIKDKQANEIILRIKDKRFRIPNTSSGKNVLILLDAKVVDSSYKTSEWYSLEVRGIKFK